MFNGYRRDDAGEMADLPPELTALHRRLAADSERWLRTLPPSDGMADYARTMPQRMTATQNSTRDDTSSPRREVSQDMKGRISMPSPRNRLRLFLPVAAAILVVALLAITFTQFKIGHTQPGSPGKNTPTVQHDTGWVALPKLDVTTAFDANTPPAIAPTDPNVVYETLSDGRYGNHSTMRRTDDGGNTWQTLPMPVPSDKIEWMGITVSPTDAHTAFLTLIDDKVADCPADLIVPNTEGNSQRCWLNYYSADAGAHWTLLHFSFKAAGFDHLFSQGNRLFASTSCVDSGSGFPCTHIVMSADGGKTWQTVDAALTQGGNPITAFTVADTSLFAVTCAATSCDLLGQVTRTVWQSDDAGAHWIRNGATPTNNVFDTGVVTATVDKATGKTLLYAVAPTITSVPTNKEGGQIPNYSESPRDLYVSADGGKSWVSAPAQGIPAGMKPWWDIGNVGTLQDGSVVASFIPLNAQDDFAGSVLFAWKLGDSAWHQIAPPLTVDLGSLITTPSPATTQGTLWLITQNRINTPGLPTFIFQKYTA